MLQKTFWPLHLTGSWLDSCIDVFVNDVFVNGVFVSDVFVNGIFISDIFVDGIFVSDVFVNGVFVFDVFVDGIFVFDEFVDGVFVKDDDTFAEQEGDEAEVIEWESPSLGPTINTWILF